MKRKKVIRCIHGANLRDIKDGSFKSNKVGVYYGFRNYKRTATQILSLIRIARKENPALKPRDIEVYEISPGQSDRHAHHTMVYVDVDVDTVKKDLHNYISL